MCAINPTHKKRFIIDIYTSKQMTPEFFENLVMTILLKNEIKLNENGSLRFHLKESKEQAD